MRSPEEIRLSREVTLFRQFTTAATREHVSALRVTIREFQLHVYVEQKHALLRAFLGHWPITEVDLHRDHVLKYVFVLMST